MLFVQMCRTWLSRDGLYSQNIGRNRAGERLMGHVPAFGMQFGMHFVKASPGLVALVFDLGAQDMQRGLYDFIHGVREFFGFARRNLAPYEHARVAHERQIMRDLGWLHVRTKPHTTHAPANR